VEYNGVKMSNASMVMLTLLVFTIISANTSAQCWAIAGINSTTLIANFTGLSARISGKPQNVSTGSAAFWIGYKVKSGGFVQLGYALQNKTSYHYGLCNQSSCSDVLLVKAGYPYWFYEYFPNGYIGTSFYGAIGYLNSVKLNSTNYTIRLVNANWSFYANGIKLGAIEANTLGASYELGTPIYSIEYTTKGNSIMALAPTLFSNISVYSNHIPTIFEGSQFRYIISTNHSLCSNNYGIVRLSPISFEAGTGLPFSNASYEYGRAYTQSNSNRAYSPRQTDPVVEILLIVFIAVLIISALLHRIIS